MPETLGRGLARDKQRERDAEGAFEPKTERMRQWPPSRTLRLSRSGRPRGESISAKSASPTAPGVEVESVKADGTLTSFRRRELTPVPHTPISDPSVQGFR